MILTYNYPHPTLQLWLEHLLLHNKIEPKQFGRSIEPSCLVTSSQSVETKQCCRSYRPDCFVAFADVDITQLISSTSLK